MNTHTVSVVYIGCFILAILLGVLRGYIKRQTRKFRNEQHELLKWQLELENRASEIHEKKHASFAYKRNGSMIE